MLRVWPLVTARRPSRVVTRCSLSRLLSDTPKSDVTTNQVVVTQGSRGSIQGTEDEQRVRVRRARPSDTPRVLRLVRDTARAALPAIAGAPAQAANVVLADYVARALAQGHSMVAEGGEARRWSALRGAALAGAVCAWDASLLDRWARCVRCPRAQRILRFKAHCLRAPALHEKYQVHSLLQVILIVPEAQNNSEIIQVLAKKAVQRARDVGLPLLRFDVNDENIAASLETLNMKKEWHIMYDVIPPDTIQEIKEEEGTEGGEVPPTTNNLKYFVSVYTTYSNKTE